MSRVAAQRQRTLRSYLTLDAYQKPWTLDDLHCAYMRLNMLAESTQQRYDLVVRNLSRHLCGDTAHPSDIGLNKITVDAALSFREWSLKRMRPTSFNSERRHLSALFNFAIRQKRMDANPFHDVTGAPVMRLLPKSLPLQDMRRYIEVLATGVTTDRWGRSVDLFPPQWFWLATIKTFYYTGMRKRQLIGLVWQDIDFFSKTIRLRAQTSKTRREWLIPLPTALIGDLQLLRARTTEIRGHGMGEQQVFCLPLFSTWKENFVKRQMSGDNLDNFFQRLRKQMPADMPRLSAHRIRHTTATILANSVPNLKVVQEQLGHSSITTTYGYVHADMAAMRKAVETL